MQKTVCVSVTQPALCNTLDPGLDRYAITFNVYPGINTSGPPLQTISVTLNGAQGTQSGAPLPPGSYTVCEVAVARRAGLPDVNLGVTPVPGTGQNVFNPSCIGVQLSASGTSVSFLNTRPIQSPPPVVIVPPPVVQPPPIVQVPPPVIQPPAIIQPPIIQGPPVPPSIPAPPPPVTPVIPPAAPPAPAVPTPVAAPPPPVVEVVPIRPPSPTPSVPAEQPPPAPVLPPPAPPQPPAPPVIEVVPQRPPVVPPAPAPPPAEVVPERPPVMPPVVSLPRAGTSGAVSPGTDSWNGGVMVAVFVAAVHALVAAGGVSRLAQARREKWRVRMAAAEEVDSAVMRDLRE